MSGNWSQRGQASASNNGVQQPRAPENQSTNPPPVCFNCGGPHFLVNCPGNSQPKPAGQRSKFPPSGIPISQAPSALREYSGNNANAQRQHRSNSQKGAFEFSSHSQEVSYAGYQQVPTTAQLSNNRSGFAQNSAGFQQPPGPVAPSQSYQQQGPQAYPIPPQQYGPPAQQYPYSAPQPYTAPPPNQQYGRPGYQPQPNQYAQPNAPPQYVAPPYQAPPQQYNAPSPAPYQAPQKPYQPLNTGYAGGYQGPPAPYQAPAPQPQWNNSPPNSGPPFQRPQRSNSTYSRDPSVNSSQHAYQQHQGQNHQQQSHGYGPNRRPSQTPSFGGGQMQNQNWQVGADTPRQTPQTPASTSSQQPPPQSWNGSPVKASHESRRSSQASAHYTPQDPSAGQLAKMKTPPNLDSNTLTSVKQERSASKLQDIDDADAREEGEVQSDEEDEDDLFNWDLKYAFKEPRIAETVALAQPLAAFKSTPVPLVIAWTMDVPSISRYARKDNLKEFVRSIRQSPQWSYLQEDPAFTDTELEGPLIPLSKLGAWTAAHHRDGDVEMDEIPSDTPEISRKRVRSDDPEHEQEDVDNQLIHEAVVDDQSDEPPIKRLKHEDKEQSPELVTTPTTISLIIGERGGTPCLAAIDDDVWAPQPGEGEASSGDTTEAILASLGVSGSPKPVTEDPLPPYVTTEDHISAPSSQTPTAQQHTPYVGNQGAPMPNGPPPNNNGYEGQQQRPQYGSQPSNSYENGPQPNQPYNHGPPVNMQHDPAQGPPQYGPPTNAQYGPQVPLYSAPQYGPPAPYQNGPPTNPSHAHPPYGPPQTYNNPPPNSYQQGSQQWGQAIPPPRNYGNPIYVGPQNYPPNQAMNPQYPQQYGPPANAHPNAPPQNYQQAPQQYGPPNPNSGPYGHNTQMSPTQYGPPQNTPYAASPYPNQVQNQGPYPNTNPPQYQNGQPNGAQYGPPSAYPNGPSNNIQYPGPPNQSGYTNGQGQHRQDSGYMSAHGSYSGPTAPNDFSNHELSITSEPPSQDQPNNNDTPNPLNEKVGSAQQESGRKSSDTVENADTASKIAEDGESDTSGSPLSPTSAEILGKLVRKKSNGTAKKDGPVRKIKRPQPVVAAAYSRRW